MTTAPPTLPGVLAAVLLLGMLCSSCATERATEPRREDQPAPADPAVSEADSVPASAARPAEPQLGLKVKRDWGTVVVDAGHGGDDEGAVGRSGAEEKDITLAIAREVSRALRARGFEVVETRTDDRFLPLDRRTSLANVSGASVLLSIHANSAPSPQAHGVETYYMDLASDEAALRLAERENRSGQVGNGEDTRLHTGVEELISELRMGATAQQSRDLAEIIHKGVLGAGAELYGQDTIRDRGVRTAPFWVLVDSQIPAVLVEVGYLTHSEEEQRLRTRGFHHLVGESMAESIAAFLERAARVVPSSLGVAE